MALSGRFTGYNHPVLTPARDGKGPKLRLFKVPVKSGSRTLLLRDGSVGALLVHNASWWDEHIHKLNAPGDLFDEWGYNDRPVRGTESNPVWSEHAAGSATDLDSTRHPRGVPIVRTFTSLQTRKIRNHLRVYHGVIGWGGNFRRVPDGMHFEWSDSADLFDAEVVARKLIRDRNPRMLRVLELNPGLKDVIFS